jgi:hypothetical protein
MPNPTIPIHLYAIKNYICQMDIEMLDAFLDDNRRYQLHTKSEYLQKLAVVFENFKTNGDTHLIRCKKAPRNWSLLQIEFTIQFYLLSNLFFCLHTLLNLKL